MANSRSYLAARLEAEEQARRRKEQKARQVRARRVGAIVASILFVALVGVGWLFGGGHAVFAPKVGMVGQASTEEHRAGWVVYELFDGTNCRYHRLDNYTGRVGAGTKGECEDMYTKRKFNVGAFSWGKD